MPILNWVGKDKVVNHHNDVPFRVLKKQYTFDSKIKNKQDSGLKNRIIQGDNLEVLKSLLPEFEGQVDCIYADPPYNTGEEKWVYNDNVNSPQIKKWLGQVVGKEGEDLSRHDKWLCMMYPRLKLLHRLLAKDGVIFISIDDNEQANLKLICTEVFGENNFIAQTIVQSNSAKNNAKYISVTHEYLYMFAKDIKSLNKRWEVDKTNVDEFSKRAKQLLTMNLAEQEIQKELRHLVKYPRFYDFDHYHYVDKNGAFRASDLTAPNSKNFFDIIHPETNLPCKLGTRGWSMSIENINKLIQSNKILFGADEKSVPQLKNYLSDNLTQTPKSVLFFDTQNSTRWIKSQGFDFDFPKPLELIKYLLQMIGNPNALVLDSFSGSGTTAHAVLKLNAEDDGNRKFILCEMMDYAETTTAERVRRVMNGYGEGKKSIDGLGGSFDFYSLSDTLFDANGHLNKDVDVWAIRDYVAHSEGIQPTKRLELDNLISPYALGLDKETLFLFMYEPSQITVLNNDFLSALNINVLEKRPELFVIYADKCTVSDDILTKYKIKFKRIPRDITQL